MLRYLTKRFLRFLLSLFALLSVIFVLFRIIPGDPTTIMIRDLDPSQAEQIRESFGLNAPLPEQYIRYIANVFQGDFGVSFSSQEPVLSMILPRLYNTLLIVLPGIIIIVLSAYLVGTRLGWERGSRKDKIGSYLQLSFRAVPHFVLGMLLLIVFAYNFELFPIGRMHPVGNPPEGLIEYVLVTAHHAFLPFVVFTLHFASDAFLLMRGNIIDQRDADYVRFLQLKGVQNNRVRTHAARNSLLPLITYLPTLLLIGIGGQILIEVVFSWPGLGELLVRSVNSRDFPTAQAAFFFIGFLVILGNFIVDILYGVLDPRIKQSD